jgi:hypothetical protein
VSRLVVGALVVAALSCVAGAALAEEDAVVVSEPKREAHDEVPILAYTYSAAGVSARSIGAEAYGIAQAAQGQPSVGGGGALVYGSPVNHLTLVGDASRDVTGRFAPSFAVIVRALGAPGRDGGALGFIAKYKVEGFAGTGGDGDFESEMEGGVLVGYKYKRLHIDVNGIGGAGLSDEGEVDVEGRARVGVDLDAYLRLGLDAQGRIRAHGTETLVGGRTGDFESGLQLLGGFSHFYGSVTVGPSTTNIANGVGVAGVVTFGATTL